jgi:hypothetical protein
LYLLVEGTDDTVIFDEKSAWYNVDNIEVYLDADNSKKPAYDFLNDYQIAIMAQNGNLVFGQNSAHKLTELGSKVVKTQNGYRMEMALPWAAVLTYTPAPNSLIGFDVHLTDADADGNSKKSWFSKSNNTWFEPTQMATVELTAR